jgi:hypothetical protein
MERAFRGLQHSLESQVHQHAHSNLDAFNFGFFTVISAVLAVGIYYKKELGIIREKFQNYNEEIDLV